MEDLRLKKLQQCAIHNVMARTLDANNATAATRIGELNSLHVAASMDIKKTTESLNQILAYKQEVAKQMLRCSDEKQMEQIAQVIKQADAMICKVLGMAEKIKPINENIRRSVADKKHRLTKKIIKK